MGSKLRRGTKKDGTPGKADKRLLARVKDWEKLADSDKKAYRKPGALR